MICFTETILECGAVISTVLKTIIGTLLVQLTLVVLVFGTVNPEGDLWGNVFPTVTPVSRAQKIRLLAAWEKRAPVQGLIIGSSRSMELDPAADRKSTRLNSSHLVISYAVFCLK